MVNQIVLSLGSNVGDKEKNIKGAVELLEKKLGVKVKKSPVYDTPPLYYKGQDNFYNCCVIFRLEIPAEKLLAIILTIENKLGRKKGERHGPRTIDIDIIFIGDQVIADDRLTIPHPCMQDRKFVLRPLADIAPQLVHPAVQLTIEEMLEESPDRSKITKIKNFWKDK